MHPSSPSVHHPFFVKCPQKPPLSLATIWSLLRNGSWEICSLRESCGCADEVEHPAVLGAARYIINVFSLMSLSSGFIVEVWSSLIRGVSSPLHGAGEGMPSCPSFPLCMEPGRARQPSCRCANGGGAGVTRGLPHLASAMPRCWNVAAPCPQRVNVTLTYHSAVGGQEMGQGVSLCAVSCIT